MFNLIIILLSTLNDEPKGSNNYKIAKYMIENMRDLEECSLTNLAQACYVSNSSISRFCRDIGLKDFNALKNQIAKFSVEAARLKRKFDYEKYESSSMVQSYVKNVISNLNYFLENDIEKQINTLVQEISSYQKIAAFGYMQSESVACTIYSSICKQVVNLSFLVLISKIRQTILLMLMKIILLLFFQNQEPILTVFFQEPSHSKVTKRNQRYA